MECSTWNTRLGGGCRGILLDQPHTLSNMTALGRGLGSLISDSKTPQESPRVLPIARIRPNPNQPRKVFDSEALDSLKASIEQHGVLQPINVRPVEGGYQIVAGERRWRAARLSGLTEIPVVVQDSDEARTMEVALIENLQREDLDAIEKARAFHEMMEALGYTQEQVAKRVGVSRAAVANHLRLLDLPEPIQEAVASDLITFGHAKALAALKGEKAQLKGLETVVRSELSVRATEQLAKEGSSFQRPGAAKVGSGGKGSSAPARQDPPWLVDLRKKIERSLGLPVEVHCTEDLEGKLVVKFHGREQLDVLIARVAPTAQI